MNSNDLTTLENFKAWIGLDNNPKDDAVLSRLITACSMFIQSWCNRVFASANYTDTISGEHTNVVFLQNVPITAVSSVMINGNAVPAASTVNGVGYVFGSNQVMVNGYRFPRGYNNITISYTAGYATIPFDIEQACIELCALRYRERDRIGQVSKSLAGEVVAFSQKDMSDDIKTLLQQYKRVVPV
jgi:hypothetical protein